MTSTDLDNQNFAGIFIDINNVKSKAEELREAADILRKESENIKKEWHSARAWEGPAAEQYRAKIVRLSAKLEEESNNLIKTAEALENTAERFRKIEEVSEKIFGGGGNN